MKSLIQMSIICFVFIVAACGGTNKDEKANISVRHQSAVHSKITSKDHDYTIIDNNCRVSKKFSEATPEASLAKMCNALQNDAFNEDCGNGQRKQHYVEYCPGNVWQGKELTADEIQLREKFQGKVSKDKQKHTYTLYYEMIDEKADCSTGDLTFEFSDRSELMQAYCEALLDEVRNHKCARDERETAFDEVCRKQK